MITGHEGRLHQFTLICIIHPMPDKKKKLDECTFYTVEPVLNNLSYY